MAIEQSQTEETQDENTEPQQQEQAEQESPAQEEAPPEEAKAKGEDGEGAEEGKDAETQEETPKAAEEKKKRAGGFQRQIERLEREKQILFEQLNRQRAEPQQPASQPAKEKTAEEKAAEYISSLVEQQLAARDAQQKQQATKTEFQRRYAEVRDAHPDFEDAMSSVGHIPVSETLQQVLFTSPDGPAIMYQLAKNPDELARISVLPPLDAAREIGRLEAKASGAAPQKPKSATRPPAPPTSVGGKASSSTRSLEDLPLSEYKRAYRSGRR